MIDGHPINSLDELLPWGVESRKSCQELSEVEKPDAYRKRRAKAFRLQLPRHELVDEISWRRAMAQGSAQPGVRIDEVLSPLWRAPLARY